MKLPSHLVYLYASLRLFQIKVLYGHIGTLGVNSTDKSTSVVLISGVEKRFLSLNVCV